MTSIFIEKKYSPAKRKTETAAVWTMRVVPGSGNSLLEISRNGIIKVIRVTEDQRFTYWISSDGILAAGGASGLYEYLENKLLEEYDEYPAWKFLHAAFRSARAA